MVSMEYTGKAAGFILTQTLGGKMGTPAEMANEFAFEMATSAIRFGFGVTREVGMDLADLGARRVLVLTDPIVLRLPPGERVLESLARGAPPAGRTKSACDWMRRSGTTPRASCRSSNLILVGCGRAFPCS